MTELYDTLDFSGDKEVFLTVFNIDISFESFQDVWVLLLHKMMCTFLRYYR